MIEHPEQWVDEYAAAGADIMHVHAEACRHLHRVVQQIKARGKKAAVVQRGNMPAGEQRLWLDLAELGLGNGNYVYQLNVSNSNGTFRQCKMMTAKK